MKTFNDLISHAQAALDKEHSLQKEAMKRDADEADAKLQTLAEPELKELDDPSTAEHGPIKPYEPPFNARTSIHRPETWQDVQNSRQELIEQATRNAYFGNLPKRTIGVPTQSPAPLQTHDTSELEDHKKQLKTQAAEIYELRRQNEKLASSVEALMETIPTFAAELAKVTGDLTHLRKSLAMSALASQIKERSYDLESQDFDTTAIPF